MSDEAVRLADVTIDNYRAVLKLSVGPGQENLVASNAASIAESKFHPEHRPRAIYRGDTPVGFLMYGPEETGDPSRGVIIFRLMVDRRWQRQGVGREALRRAIEEIRASRAAKVLICYDPANEAAKRLYAELGFVEVGEEDGDVIAELR